MQYKTCTGYSSVCGIGGPPDEFPARLYGSYSYDNIYDVYGPDPGAPSTGECTKHFTFTQPVDYVEAGGDGCPDTTDEESGDCPTDPSCALTPWHDCLHQTDTANYTWTDQKPAAPAPTMVCSEYDEENWGPVFTSPFSISDFRRGEPIFDLGTLPYISAIAAYYAEYARDQAKYKFRRMQGTLRCGALVEVTLRQFLDSDPFGVYTESTETFDIPADGSEVEYTVPYPSDNGLMYVWHMKFTVPIPDA